jgi:hypothetical protein
LPLNPALNAAVTLIVVVPEPVAEQVTDTLPVDVVATVLKGL